jgi:hypothetical protein
MITPDRMTHLCGTEEVSSVDGHHVPVLPLSVLGQEETGPPQTRGNGEGRVWGER